MTVRSRNVPPDTRAASQEQACSFGHTDESFSTRPCPPSPGSQLEPWIPTGTDSPLPAPSLRLLLAHLTSVPDEMGTPWGLATCGPPWAAPISPVLPCSPLLIPGTWCSITSSKKLSLLLPPVPVFPQAPDHPLRVFPSETLENLPTPALASASHQHFLCQHGHLMLKASRMLNLLSRGGGRTPPVDSRPEWECGWPKGHLSPEQTLKVASMPTAPAPPHLPSQVGIQWPPWAAGISCCTGHIWVRLVGTQSPPPQAQCQVLGKEGREWHGHCSRVWDIASDCPRCCHRISYSHGLWASPVA